MFSYGIHFNNAYHVKKYYSGSICAGVCNVLRVSSFSLDVLMYIVDVLCLSVLVELIMYSIVYLYQYSCVWNVSLVVDHIGSVVKHSVVEDDIVCNNTTHNTSTNNSNSPNN